MCVFMLASLLKSQYYCLVYHVVFFIAYIALCKCICQHAYMPDVEKKLVYYYIIKENLGSFAFHLAST